MLTSSRDALAPGDEPAGAAAAYTTRPSGPIWSPIWISSRPQSLPIWPAETDARGAAVPALEHADRGHLVVLAPVVLRRSRSGAPCPGCGRRRASRPGPRYLGAAWKGAKAATRRRRWGVGRALGRAACGPGRARWCVPSGRRPGRAVRRSPADPLIARAGTVDLVHEQQRRDAQPLQGSHQDAGLRLHALDGGEHQDGAVQDAQHPLDLSDEVGVAGGVDQVDRDGAAQPKGPATGRQPIFPGRR